MKATSIALLMLPALVLGSGCPHEEEGLANWFDVSTWPSGVVPGDDHRVEISKPILLNGVTDRLKSVTIVSGGKLVFDPTVDLSKIISDQIKIEDGGEMHIGCEDCKFDGKAEVLLTGEQNDDEPDDPEFGKKFLGVAAGGTLEIHGKDKTSWSKLTKTLIPHDIIFSTSDENQPKFAGVVFYEFDREAGTVIRESRCLKRRHVEKFLDGVSTSSVIVILSRGTFSNGASYELFDDVDAFVDILEGPKFLNGAASLDIRTQWSSIYDAWAYIIDRADDGTTTISKGLKSYTDDKPTATMEEINLTANGILYRLSNFVSSNFAIGAPRVSLSTVSADGYDTYELELDGDDFSSWLPGDKLVISSTDFDYLQAEEVEVVSVDGSKVTVKGEIKYVHWGEIYETVDMRAEVGLLTRNVLIHGEMGSACLDEDSDVCDTIDFDNFGGHTKAIKGFKKYNIEGAELTNMGQMTKLGSYPIHYHMCHDVDEDGTNPIVQSNSIHHCFSRCVTIHGTHGVHVKNNVAHDTYGHCYFLEDGGEKRTVFDGNLGLTTRKGFLTPSDVEPSTFWLTSPLVTVVNNAAAGSDQKGVGYWYLFPDAPVGPSTGLGFFKEREAKHIPVTEFRNNVAHSNGNLGLGVFRRLREDHGILGCQTYNPRVDPFDSKSELVPAVFTDFTGFKNREGNVKMRATTVVMENFKLADSAIGAKFTRNMLDGYQLFKNAVIIGESPNVGHSIPRWITKFDGKRVRLDVGRSLPIPWRSSDSVVGIKIESEGPLHLHNVAFKGFKNNDFRLACGIVFKDDFFHGMGPSSSVKGFSFDFEEPEAQRVCHYNQITGADETSMTIKDLDGSLVGTPGLNVVANDEYLQTGLDCETNSLWNMTVCNGNFHRFYLYPKPEEAGATFITKSNDLASTNAQRRVSYTVNPDVRVVMHWSEESLPTFNIRALGVRVDRPWIVGFCLPEGVAEQPVESYLDFSFTDSGKDHSDIKVADSMETLESDSTGLNTFIDTEKGIAYIKFIEEDEMGPDDYADCPNGNLAWLNCPSVIFNFRKLEGIDLTKADCTKR